MKISLAKNEAKARGDKYYFTGEPCKHGHLSKRYIGGGCVECVKLKTKALRTTDRGRQKAREYTAQYRKLPHVKAYDKAYNAKHGKRIRLRHRYKLTLEEFDAMKTAQNGACLICEEIKPLHVDHDHRMNVVRGLLCYRCNLWLGVFEKCMADGRFAEYLRQRGS